MHVSGKRAVRGFALGLTTIAVVVPAASAATVYPTAKGSTFTDSNDGWQESGKSCAAVLGLLSNTLCEVTTRIDTTNGKPAGSLSHEFRNVVGVLSPVVGPTAVATSVSPKFTVPSYTGVPLTAGLAYDRRFVNASLTAALPLPIPPGVTSTVTLVDDTPGATTLRQTIASETPGGYGNAFTAAPAAPIAAGVLLRITSITLNSRRSTRRSSTPRSARSWRSTTTSS